MADIPYYQRNLTKSQLLALKATFAKKVGYRPSQGQADVHRSNKRFRVVCAGARYGKSMLAGFEMAFFLMFPDFRIWAVAPVYELADKEFNWALEFLSRYVFEDGRNVVDMGRLSNPQKGSRSFQMPNGSFMRTKSTEKPDTLLGEEVDLIVLCEASKTPREVWERQLRARIGPRNGMLLAPSTGAGDSGLFVDMVNYGKNPMEYPDWKTWEFSTIDNPTFSREEYEMAKQSLPSDVFKEQYEGKLVSRRGFVFTLDDSHILDSLPSEFAHLPLVVSIQYSFKNPCVVAFMVSPRKGEYIIFDEIYVKEQIIEEVVPLIRSKIKGRKLLSFVTDYWDTVLRNTLTNLGIQVDVNNERTSGRTNAIMARVRAVQSCLRYEESLAGPKLKIYKNCTNIIEEFRKCKWQDKPSEMSDRLEAETPLPKYFQAPQAVSHAVAMFETAYGYDVYGCQKQEKEG